MAVATSQVPHFIFWSGIRAGVFGGVVFLLETREVKSRHPLYQELEAGRIRADGLFSL